MRFYLLACLLFLFTSSKRRDMPESAHEQSRLKEPFTTVVPPWQKWGPYVAERAWGTVREDYSWNGDAWSYFPQDKAISKVFRWGEDGIAGWCDRYQVIAFAPAFWNGKDPILKERLFGLSAHEGNHAEDVKECYYHLDGTPTHSYMKYLYKYPQNRFPYEELVQENQKRATNQPEYELVDTGVFADNRYFDIFIEYAKGSPEDICIKIEAFNRSSEESSLDIIPHLWFRNQWTWGDTPLPEPTIVKGSKTKDALCLVADDSKMLSPPSLTFDYHLGKRFLYASLGAESLFTNNENHWANHSYFKDGFHKKIVHKENTTNPEEKGTKACFHYSKKIAPHESYVVYLRLTPQEMAHPLEDIESIIQKRKKEADAFYETVHPKKATAEEKMIQRQAFAGLLWSKQIYLYDVNAWLEGDSGYARPPDTRLAIRNQHWRHLNSMRILCMPDKWEYPWFAAWDLAFHCVTLALIDMEFAKEQLWLLMFDQFQHPNGQIPAYEWEFSDLNPPVQAWAALRIYAMEKERFGREDREFLKRCLPKLLMNFAWWVNRVDSAGNNVFEGGFLGLDNIALIDRSTKFAEGVRLQQSDGTGWMAMFCLNLMRISLELAQDDPTYESLATKFFQHFIYIAHAMKMRGNQRYELWSEKDGFFYDVLTFPDGQFAKCRIRSLVGLIPLYAVDILDEDELEKFPEFRRNFEWFIQMRSKLVEDCIILTTHEKKKRYVLTLVDQEHLSRILRYVWDPKEFRSEFGLRSLSKIHEGNPFVFKDRSIGYEPAESLYKVKGGNSNWRGPIWFPTSYLLIQSLRTFGNAFKEEIKIELPDEKAADLKTMAHSFSDRLISLFKKDSKGIRPFLGHQFPFAKDPHWKDHILFYEYYHGDNGKGLGASHQTGWSALVANLIDEHHR